MQRTVRFLATFALLLVGVVAWSQSVKGTVKDASGGGLPGVSVAVVGTTKGTLTNADGTYDLPLGKGKHQVSYSFVGYASQTKVITIDGGDVMLDVNLSSADNELSTVVISTGSRSVQRTLTNTPLPIDILSASDLRATGQVTFDKALQYRVPSFNTVNTPVNDATSLLDPYEIRNMGPSRTLVLINGKRKNLSSLVYIQTSPGRGESGADISAIPTEAIKRVEILRDGASAQYGSDAIAGVMNIILKDRQDYGSITFNAGITHKGDGEQFGVTLNNGANIGEKGFINYTASFSDVALANRPGVVSAEGEAADFGASLSDVKAFLSKYPDARNINGAPATTAAKFVVNGGSELGANTELYYNAAYVYKKVNSFANYRTPYWRTTDDGLLTKAGDPYIGYVPTFEGDLNDYNGTVGFRSNINDWKTDVSYTTGGNKQLYTINNSRNRSLGKNSPISFKPGGYEFFHNVGNIDIAKAVQDNLSFAFGAEFRAETYKIFAGDTASVVGSGADSFPGIGEANAGTFTRNNLGGYVDLGYDVTKNFLINGTARLERYSDFGNAFVWKLSSRYKITDALTVRGSVSTGFRAPSLHQINLQLAQASFVPGQGIQTKGIVNNRSAQARLLQVPSLKPEKSTNLTLGLGYNPTKDINITVDYFNINVKDRIILSSEIDSTATPSDLNNVLRNNGIVAVSFFTNGINTTTSGIDFVFNWRNIGLGAGKMAVNVAGNYMLGNKLDDAFVSSDLIRNAGKKTFDVIQEALLLSSRPQFKIIWGADYTVNKFNVNLNNTVFGPTTFRQNGLNSNLKTVFKTNMVTDLGVNYQFTSKVGLGVNIQNIFNVMPKWELQALNAAGEAILKDAAAKQANVNAITFNGRYSNVTYDGSQFSQMGLTAAAQLTVKF